jgi:hypothetical protein
LKEYWSRNFTITVTNEQKNLLKLCSQNWQFVA